MDSLPGTDRSYEILVCEYHRRALAYALSLVRSEADAQDLVQEAFVTAYRQLEKFDRSRDFGAWLRGIVRLKYLELLRRRRTHPVAEAEAETGELELCYERWEQATRDGRGTALEALQHCLDRLPAPARVLVDLFYFEKQRGEAIAARLGVSEATVWKRLERVRQALLDCIDKQMTES